MNTNTQTTRLYHTALSPFCRKVREALSELDLTAVIYPCPPGGTRFRPRAEELGGKGKEHAGRATGDEQLEAEGHKDQASGNIKQAGEKVKDVFK